MRKICLWNTATAALLSSHKLPDSSGRTAVFFSPDGRFFVSAGPDGRVRWHEGATGQTVIVEPSTPHYLSGLALCPDGRTLALANSKGKIGVLLPENGQMSWLKQLEHDDTQAVAVSPDGTQIVSAGNNTIRCWESGMGKQLWHAVAASPSLVAVSYSRDGRTLVTGADAGKLQVWDARTGKEVRTLAPLRGIAGALTFSPDGQLLACAARDHQRGPGWTPADADVILWDTATWKELGRLSGHDGGVSGICFAPDGRALYSASHDGTVLKWDWLGRITAHAKAKEASAISERTWEALGNDDVKSAYVAISQLIAAREPAVRLLATKLKPIPALEAKRLSNLIRDLSSDRFAMRDAATRELRALGQRSEDALHEALKADHPVETRMRIEQLLAERRRSPYSTQERQDLRAIQVLGLIGTAEARKILEGLAAGSNEAHATQLARSLLPTRQPPQARRFGDVLERRLRSPEINLPRILHEHNGTVNGLAFDPLGRLLATAGADGTVAMRNTLTGDLLCQQNEVDSNGLFSLAFAADGKSVATGGADGRLRIWDAATGKELRILKAHTDKVTALAFHPAGKLLASGGFDRTIRLWDLDTGQQRPSNMRHDGRVTALSFSWDGKLLVSGGTIRTIHNFLGPNQWAQAAAERLHIWDVNSGQQIRALKQRGSVVAFVNDRVVTAGGMVPDVERTKESFSVDGYDRIVMVEVVTGKELGSVTHRGNAVAVSPDGHWMVSAGGDWQHLEGSLSAYNGRNAELANFKLTLWDMVTTKPVMVLSDESATQVRFSPNGRFLASASSDGSVKLWDVVALGRDRSLPPDLPPAVLAKLWDRLADREPQSAFGAQCTLTFASDKAVDFLRAKWQPLRAADEKVIRKLINDLDADKQPVREAATRVLEKLALQAGPLVRQALAAKPSPEMTKRLQIVLAAVEQARFHPDELRRVRLVQILELVGSAGARELLQTIAQGTHEAPHQQSARAALIRLQAR